jgi:hypothetical protein
VALFPLKDPLFSAVSANLKAPWEFPAKPQADQPRSDVRELLPQRSTQPLHLFRH